MFAYLWNRRGKIMLGQSFEKNFFFQFRSSFLINYNISRKIDRELRFAPLDRAFIVLFFDTKGF
jgi:hypothetical protein